MAGARVVEGVGAPDAEVGMMLVGMRLGGWMLGEVQGDDLGGGLPAQ